jgi:hypothetical protein
MSNKPVTFCEPQLLLHSPLRATTIVAMRVRWTFALLLACEQPKAPAATPAVDRSASPQVPLGQHIPTDSSVASMDAPNHMLPDVVATLTRWTLIRRVLADGGLTKAGREVLVVQRDGIAEIRDGGVDGPMIKRITIDKQIVAKLDSVVARSDWRSLPLERGTTVPDGHVEEIGANGRNVKRFGDATTEPIFREARTILNAIWDQMDP